MSMLDEFISFVKQCGVVLMALTIVGFVLFLLANTVGIAQWKHIKMVSVPLVLVFVAGLSLRAVAVKADAYRNLRYSKIRKKTDKLAGQKRFAEAAELNMREALKELNNNYPLVYTMYCKDAFEMWLKAQEPGKALQEARNVLSIYLRNNGDWLRYNSADYVENLTSMVSDFFGAGYLSEGAVFAGEVNHQLEKYGLPMRCAAVPVHKNIFPASCTDCGANLSHTPYQDTAQCGYCKAIIYPLNPLPEIKNETAIRARAANIFAVNAAADAANRSVKAERRINLPPAKPIEKGTPQTFYANTISYTIPANWERRSTVILEQYDDFHSPDDKFAFSLSVTVIQGKKGDMMQEFNKIIAEQPEAKVLLKVLDGDTPGIFSLIEGDRINFKMNNICWESYPPPNAKGETKVLKIRMSFPAEEFELHKQLISDIYGSFKIRK